MPILLIVLLAIVIAEIGFWKTLSALLGAVLALGLFIFIVLFFMGVVAYVVFRRMWRRW